MISLMCVPVLGNTFFFSSLSLGSGLKINVPVTSQQTSQTQQLNNKLICLLRKTSVTFFCATLKIRPQCLWWRWSPAITQMFWNNRHNPFQRRAFHASGWLVVHVPMRFWNVAWRHQSWPRPRAMKLTQLIGWELYPTLIGSLSLQVSPWCSGAPCSRATGTSSGGPWRPARFTSSSRS